MKVRQTINKPISNSWTRNVETTQLCQCVQIRKVICLRSAPKHRKVNIGEEIVTSDGPNPCRTRWLVRIILVIANHKPAQLLDLRNCRSFPSLAIHFPGQPGTWQGHDEDQDQKRF